MSLFIFCKIRSLFIIKNENILLFHFVAQLWNIRTLFDIDLCFFLLWERLLLQNIRLSCKVSLLYYLKFIAILSNLLQPNESVARFVHIMLRFLLLKALHIYKNHQITDFAWNWVLFCWYQSKNDWIWKVGIYFKAIFALLPHAITQVYINSKYNKVRWSRALVSKMMFMK